jgi:hypothetical protein
MIGREQALQVKQLGASWTKLAQWLICSPTTVLAIASSPVAQYVNFKR